LIFLLKITILREKFMPIPQLDRAPLPRRAREHWRARHGAPPPKNLSDFFRRISWIKLTLLIIGGVLGVVVLMFVFFALTLPSPEKLLERQVAQSTKIYDREGATVIYEIHGDKKRTLVALDQIPQDVREATVAIEDKNFYQHGGFSVWAILRTAITNIIFNRSGGGSTLTQQFVKNALLTNEKKYTRKIKEVILAYRLENKFSKDEILQMYLNEIPYGSSNYGVEAASQFYFGKPVKEVNLAEAAILAALPQAPSRYSPYGQNKDLLIGRQQYTLDQMAKQGYITQADADQAKKTEIKFQQRLENITAPHFVMYIKQLLEDKYGTKEVEQGGLKIYTTLDVKKQQIAEDAIKNQADKNEKNYNASNAALVSLDPKTGEVLAMVGSRDYFDDKIDGQFNVAIAPRQPGSSFKPVVYAAAFSLGYTPDTMVYDTVTNFSTDPNKKYEPHNYDSAEHGPVSFRQALAGSLNIPAVKAMYLAGVDNVLKLAQKLNYSTLNDKDRFGLSLVLGGGEVKLLEHTNAYSAFATAGEVPDLIMIKKVEDNDGRVLEETKDIKRHEVLSANVAKMINSILSDNNARAYIFGAKNYLTLPDRQVAAKTGTTNDYRDAWTIGYTPSLVTGVWVGNNDNSEMKRGADGSQVAAPIWNRFMREALLGTPAENLATDYAIDPATPPILLGRDFGAQKIKIDRASGLLANDQTPDTFIEEKSYLQPHDLLYFINRNNPLGPPPANPTDDPQFTAWEAGAKQWIDRQQQTNPDFSTATPPTDYDNAHQDGLKPTFTVNGLADGQTIAEPLPIISVAASAPRGVNRVEYLVNDLTFAVNYTTPFALNHSLSFLRNGSQKITVKVCDDLDNCSSQNFNVTLNLSQTTSGSFGLRWLAPTANSQLTAKNLPLSLQISLTSPENIAVIKFFVQAPHRDPELAQTKKMIRADTEQGSWQPDQTPSGDYQFWAEAIGWQGAIKTTERVTVKF